MRKRRKHCSRQEKPRICDTRPVPNAYTGRLQPLLTLYTQHCKQWNKIPINSCEAPPSCTCNTTEK